MTSLRPSRDARAPEPVAVAGRCHAELEHGSSLEEVSCNLCGRTETEFLFQVVDDATGHQFSIVRCRSCALAYVNPRPRLEVIASYYPEDSYYSYSFRDQTTLKRRVRSYVLEEQGGYPHSGKDGIAVRLLGKLAASLSKGQILMSVPFVPQGRALDVGCGCGEHLLWLREHGWSEVHGVEISKRAAELAQSQGLNVFCGVLAQARYPDGYFDHVSLVHVLEHTHDPMQTLREAHRVLKPGALLVVGVPNFGSYENLVFGKRQSILKEVPRHLYHFSRSTLTRMLEETGFRLDRVAGKSFFIPRVNGKSLELVFQEESLGSFLCACCRLFLEKPLRFALARDKEAFGQLFTFYAIKEP